MNEQKTQGTELYVLDTTVSPVAILKIANLYQLGGMGGQASQIPVTSFDDRRYTRKKSGLIDQGAADMSLRWDPADESHQWLHANAGGSDFQFAIGLAEVDGVSQYGTPPTVNGSDDGFELPTSRHWRVLTGSVNKEVYDASLDSVWDFQSALQISGEIVDTPATT